MALLSHVFGRGGFVAVKIERRNEPTGEQLAASVILTGASALRMMRAERRQMGYISWKDLDPDEERRVLNVRKRRLRGKVPCLGKQDYAATIRL